MVEQIDARELTDKELEALFSPPINLLAVRPFLEKMYGKIVGTLSSIPSEVPKFLGSFTGM
ncbi:MAG: hypothetical protein Q7R43_01840 [Candidatus Daviesbacteria bacterium]|nr:hypothetical protein [Candidatus Daviesbacteria bacterium]